MDLQQLTLEAARVAQDVGKHAFQAQANPSSMVEAHIPDVPGEPPVLPVNERLVPFIENRLTGSTGSGMTVRSIASRESAIGASAGLMGPSISYATCPNGR